MNKVVVNFKWNEMRKHNPVEFDRQLKMQNEGLNDLTLKEYLTNRANYYEYGRSNEGSKEQTRVRGIALKAKIDDLRERYPKKEKAEIEIEANEWLGTQNALHSPDQVAGGNPKAVTGVGDRRVNFSIGVQWRYRAKAFHADMDNAIKSELRQFNLSDEQLYDLLVEGNFENCPPTVINHLQKTKPNIELSIENEAALKAAIAKMQPEITEKLNPSTAPNPPPKPSQSSKPLGFSMAGLTQKQAEIDKLDQGKNPIRKQQSLKSSKSPKPQQSSKPLGFSIGGLTKKQAEIDKLHQAKNPIKNKTHSR